MKNFKKVLALVLVVATLLSFATVASAATSASYKDAADIAEDREAAIDVLSYLGILEGFPGGEFRPEATLTRAQASKIIAMLKNGSVKIENLYTAANPFTDAKGHWAESYIAYCYRAGIIDGVGNLMFNPDGDLTYAAFLKMALIVLGYDMKKEGLTGASWMVNSLELAKKAGLLKGLNVTDYSAAVTRADAAQILLNALCSEIVDYGYEYKGSQFVTVAGAVVVKDAYLYLSPSWGLSYRPGQDCFGRPYHYWYSTKNGEPIAVYMDELVATNTTGTTACDVLNAAGVENGDRSSIITLDVYVNGKLQNTVSTDDANNSYVASYVLGHELHAHKAQDGYDCILGVYDPDAATKIDTTGWTEGDAANKGKNVWGNVGSDTELYHVGDGEYILVVVDNYLGQVSKVAKTNVSKDGHIIAATNTTISFWNECALTGADADDSFEILSDEFAVGDYVIFNASEKACHTPDDTLDFCSCTDCGTTAAGAAVHVVDVAKATIKTGTLTGFVDHTKKSMTMSTEIDGTVVLDNAYFHLGHKSIKDIDAVGATVDFIYDLNGYVIGAKATASAQTYGVIDWIYTHVDNSGLMTLNASVVAPDGSIDENAVITHYNGVPVSLYPNSAALDNLKRLGLENGAFYDHLVKVTKTEGGYALWVGDPVCPETSCVADDHDYVLANIVKGDSGDYDTDDDEWFAGEWDEANFKGGSGVAFGTDPVYTKAGTPNLWATNDDSDDSVLVAANSATTFLFHMVDGSYKSYVGYENVPSALIGYVEWVDDNYDGYAELVYGANVIINGSIDLIWTDDLLKQGTTTIDGVVYNMWKVWVGDTATIVYTDEDLADPLDGESVGLFSIIYAVDETGILYGEFAAVGATLGTNSPYFETETVTIATADQIKGNVILTNEFTNAIDLTDVPVYVYDEHNHTVDASSVDMLPTADVVTDADYGTDRDEITLVYNALGALVAVYYQQYL